MSSNKCADCGLANYAADERCRRCGAALGGVAEALDAVYDRPKRSLLKRVLITPAIICVLLLICYASLLATSEPLTLDQKQSVRRAINVLDDKGFAREAFILRHLVSFRQTDNWWNKYVGHADAYAATNFPFEVVTLYPDFFSVPVDDTERAMMLLHESNHLRGRGEPAAFASVWRDKKQLGWIEDIYGETRAWKSVRSFTERYAPQLFTCGADQHTDCVQ